MTRDEAQKLLGGYATGSLSEEERIALLEAALDDQELFDQLAEEDAVKELIDVPGVRDRLIVGLTPKPQTRSIWAWLLRPWPITGLVGTVAAIVVLWAVLPRTGERTELPEVSQSAPLTVPQPVEVAGNRAPEQAAPPPVRAKAAPPVPDAAGAKDTATGAATSRPFAAPPATAAPSVAVGEIQIAQDKRQAQPQSPRDAEEPVLKAEAAAPVPPVAPPAAAAGGFSRAIVVNGLPSNTGVAASTPAPPPPAAKPVPPVVPTDALRSGFAGGAIAPAAAARADLATVAPFGLRYQVLLDTLQITPVSQGWITVRGTGAGDPIMLLTVRQVPAAAALSVPIPATVQMVEIEFTVSPPTARGGPVNGAEERRELEGSATVANPGPNSRLRISIPARP